MENLQNEIKEKILEYFNKTENSFLEILDVDTRTYSGYNKSHYTGVTLNYIKEYVCDNKYNIKDLIDVINGLGENEQIRALKCNDIGEWVFENKLSEHWNAFDKEEDPEHFQKLEEYLNEQIENE